MKLSEDLEEMAGDYTYISGSWLNICAEEAKALEQRIAELEKLHKLAVQAGKNEQSKVAKLEAENSITWTKVKPNKIGLYWCYQYSKIRPVTVWSITGKELYTNEDGGASINDEELYKNVYWSKEPIPIPKPPEGE